MSRILRHKKLILTTFVSLGVTMVFAFYTDFWYLSLLFVAILVCWIINKLVIRKMSAPTADLNAFRDVKEISSLVIGDVCSDTLFSETIDKNKALYFMCPKRSLEASYQILLHTFSRIASNGSVVIIDGKSNEQYMPFDVIFFSEITKLEKNIDSSKMRFKYPIIFYPLVSVLILIGYKRCNYKESFCFNKEITDFCKEKKIKLTYLVKA